jgi:hypothetical protein
MYHSNYAAIITAAILVTGELQVPFLGYQISSTPTTLTPKTPKTEFSEDRNSGYQLNSEVYDLWADGREDTFSEKTSGSRYLGNFPRCLGSEPQRARHNINMF